MPQTISPWAILTSDDKYPEREQSDECTTLVRINAADTAERGSRLLDYLGVKARISSGFRTLSANAASKGSKGSAHLTGEAVDLEDPAGKLARLILADLSVLERFDLYMENPQYTVKTVNGVVVQWIHLQTRRTRSGNRVFTP